MTAVKIERFRPGQEALVAHIHNTAFAGWIKGLDPCFSYRDLRPEDISAWSREPSSALWLAYADGQPAAYANCHTQVVRGQRNLQRLSFDLTHPDWGQSKIGVLPGQRRKGIATAFLRAILRDFAAQGGALAVAWAYNFNPAASALFTRLGFVNHERFYYASYSAAEPFSFDSVYTELDLTRPLPGVPLNPALTVRAPRDGDARAFVDLFRRSAPFAFGSEPSRQQIERWLCNPDSEVILVGEFDGKVVGAMEFFKTGVIGVPGVLPEYRNRGLGTTLFYRLLERMQRHGHAKAIGDTGVVQAEMMRLYRRFGFDLSKKLLNWVKVLRSFCLALC